jgi:two-component system chemotaxis response regulator CheY
MRKIIRKTLEKLGVFSIVEACNGLDALTKLHGLNANLIISDWNMPEMNGIDFVKAVRALEEYNNVPILMVTTVNYKREVFEAVKSGVNGYLVKPFKDDELIQKIQTLLKYH